MSPHPSATGPKRRVFRRGAATVEFAVVAPLFLLLLAGIIEFGQAFRIEHAMANAARRGARSASVDGATASGVSEQVRSHCTAALGVKASDVTVEVAVNGAAGANLAKADRGDEIAVTVSIPFAKAGAGFFANTFSSTTLRSTCTLEHE